MGCRKRQVRNVVATNRKAGRNWNSAPDNRPFFARVLGCFFLLNDMSAQEMAKTNKYKLGV